MTKIALATIGLLGATWFYYCNCFSLDNSHTNKRDTQEISEQLRSNSTNPQVPCINTDYKSILTEVMSNIDININDEDNHKIIDTWNFLKDTPQQPKLKPSNENILSIIKSVWGKLNTYVHRLERQPFNNTSINFLSLLEKIMVTQNATANQVVNLAISEIQTSVFLKGIIDNLRIQDAMIYNIIEKINEIVNETLPLFPWQVPLVLPEQVPNSLFFLNKSIEQ